VAGDPWVDFGSWWPLGGLMQEQPALLTVAP
jgi:hypothetical protein